MEEEGGGAESSKFLLSHDDPERAVDPEMQARLEALLEAAGRCTLISPVVLWPLSSSTVTLCFCKTDFLITCIYREDCKDFYSF